MKTSEPKAQQVAVDPSIRSTTGDGIPSSAYTRRTDEIFADGFSSSRWPETIFRRHVAAAHLGGGGGGFMRRGGAALNALDFIVTPITDQIGPIDSVSKTEYYDLKNHFSEPQCKMTVLPPQQREITI
ncbi:hypothetical protein F511_20773 [Dorcoceras hygrometricum]|uniref:Uncharacterized protein n=1 Tax=Dorcoceras hygrometricum TaxID=472368 RepID=A0A2Z7CU07_9LAMI|nr:hypothetical protein F511_20773 [Dorcoceras hygrometricum]